MTTFSHAPVEVPLVADHDRPAPLTAQIVTQLRAALADGQLVAGERLPSTRALAVSLGVSRTVVTTAYAQLFAEGWLESRHGSGTYVATGATAPTLSAPQAPGVPGRSMITKHSGHIAPQMLRDHEVSGGGGGLEPGLLNLQPRLPWTEGIDRAAWR